MAHVERVYVVSEVRDYYPKLMAIFTREDLARAWLDRYLAKERESFPGSTRDDDYAIGEWPLDNEAL